MTDLYRINSAGCVSRLRVHARAERGTTLVVALMFLLILTIFGVTAVTTSTLQEKMASNAKDQSMAFQSAESAMRAAELWLADPRWRERIPVGSTKAVDTVWAFNTPWGSGAPDTLGYAWWNNNTNTEDYSTVTGVSILDLAAQPRFVIEERTFMPDSPVVPSTYTEPPGRFYYRVTSYSVGATRNSEAILQSSFVNRYR